MPLIDTTAEFGQRVERRLDDEQVVWMTTVSPGNTPQPSPVWFVRDNDTVLIYSQPNKPKLRNIEANPTVSLSFNATFHGDDVVVFTGEATVDNDAPAAFEQRAFVEKYRGGIESLGMTPESFSAEYSVPVRVTLGKLRGF